MPLAAHRTKGKQNREWTRLRQACGAAGCERPRSGGAKNSARRGRDCFAGLIRAGFEPRRGHGLAQDTVCTPRVSQRFR
jgi:hypothetical protein